MLLCTLGVRTCVVDGDVLHLWRTGEDYEEFKPQVAYDEVSNVI